jgi:type I pantothenate kinase
VLRAQTSLTLTEKELEAARGINDRIDLEEVATVYLPLTRLLNLYVAATQNLHRVSATFLGTMAPKMPYVIGIAGSVAVGKSTSARILQSLLARWPEHPRVELITTDGFLYPNAVLEERGLMNRKGFPESYDTKRLLQFVRDVKAGMPEVAAPVYSHVIYDVMPNQEEIVRQPDYFDFSIYIDAIETDIENWFIERFQTLRKTIFQDPDSFFKHFADFTEDQAIALAHEIWAGINGKNLKENIEPTRSRASLVLHKGADHKVNAVHLRKL